ncbi:ribosomal RNA small subunit methyltransferase A [Candidatus Dojkabacteria bacterium]|nr:ribosomal RNA small subunit methyltransferase A [Candidatus Dojkabacteria bacterium]
MQTFHSHNFKKQLGQNFIRSTATIKKILGFLEIQPSDNIIEIGPGDGRFTDELVQYDLKKLTLVEIDTDLISFLKNKFDNSISKGTLEILNQNILDLELSNWNLEFKLYGSLPYNISKRIIAKFIECENLPERMVYIVQKEVAQDYVAQAPDASYIGNYIKIFADVKLVMSIPKEQFYPMPKVDGGVLLIKPRKVDLEEGRAIAKFIYNGFRNKRKKLSKVLNSIYRDIDWVKEFEALKINPNARAQELEYETWLKLFNRNTIPNA